MSARHDIMEMFRAMLGDDTHSHKCPECGNVWSHDGNEIESTGENKVAHTCTKCALHTDACYKRFRGEVHA